ncbi:MAG: MFS transporter [Chloroflexota bacterium]
MHRTSIEPATIAMERVPGTGAVIWSQFLLRLASGAGVLVIGAYFVYLRDHDKPVNSLILGVVSALVFVTELSFAPLAGALSDQKGRRLFLVSGPVMAAIAVLLIPLGIGIKTALPLGLIVGIVGIARLVEGVGTAVAVPATLGFLAEMTDCRPMSRGRVMALFELASVVGIAAGAVLGPLIWDRLHLRAFVLLAGLYLIAALMVLTVREKQPSRAAQVVFSVHHYLEILSYRPLALFIPTWVAANAILGVWVSAQIEFVLAARLHVSGQHFVGSLHDRAGTLSEILGGYVLWFALCVVVWALFLGRFSRRPTLLVTIFGSVPASVGLIALNHGGSPVVFIPLVLVGIFLEAGFTPTALTYLADISQRFAHDRGRLMGLYSVMLGIGQLVGSGLGGLFAQIAYFDGLAYLTMILASIGTGGVALSLWLTPLESEGGLNGAV